MIRRAFLARGLALPAGLALGAFGPPARAAAEARPVHAPGGVALGGIDPVSYARPGGPVAGSPAHALMWRGAVWHFETAETLAAFEADPRAHAPRYGGHCALAMAAGRFEPGAPAVWTRHEGRLYLLRTPARQLAWQADAAAHVASADRHWKAHR